VERVVDHSTSRRLIVSADDFGMSPGVNAGILHAHREGILTDVGLMVNGQAFDEALQLARSNPRLRVGLHLTLAQGWAAAPPAEIPLLADANGLFRRNPIWSGLRFFFLPGVRAQLRREIRAQLDKFRATGLPLSHVDGHVTIHAHPTVLSILVALAPEYGIRAVRLPSEPLLPALRFDAHHLGRKIFEATVFAALSRYARKRLAHAGIAHPQRMFGLHQTGRISERYVLALLAQLPPGISELYCHAALPDDECRRWRPADYESEKEVAALTSPRVRAEIERRGIELVSYSALYERG
jgi:hopanoid biosynthesis associated protein HpnK